MRFFLLRLGVHGRHTNDGVRLGAFTQYGFVSGGSSLFGLAVALLSIATAPEALPPCRPGGGVVCPVSVRAGGGTDQPLP